MLLNGSVSILGRCEQPTLRCFAKQVGGGANACGADSGVCMYALVVWGGNDTVVYNVSYPSMMHTFGSVERAGDAPEREPRDPHRHGEW